MNDVLSSGLKSKKVVAEAMALVFVGCVCCWCVEYDLERPKLVGKYEVCSGKLVEEVTIRECEGSEDEGSVEDVRMVVGVGYSNFLTTVLDGTKEWTRTVRIAAFRSRFLVSCSRGCRVLPVADMARKILKYEELLPW